MSTHTPQSFVQATKREEQVSIGREAAIALHDSGWHTSVDARTIAGFQLSTVELAVPFSVFHKALEDALGRPVWTHELGLNLQGLFDEFNGKAKAPTMQEIIEQIPAEKRIIVEL